MGAGATTSPLSGAPMRRWMNVPLDWRRPEAPVEGGYALWWSRRDGFGQLLPRPHRNEVPEFYRLLSYYTHHASENESGPSGDGGLLPRLLMALAWRMDRGVEPSREWWRETTPEGARSFLEIGCGSGANMIAASAFLKDVAGVEPDEAARRVARDQGLFVVSGTAEELPGQIEARDWDVVAMMHVLEHCLDPLAALANARALLAPGGRLVVETPNNECLGLAFKGAAWLWLDVPRHLNFFTERSLRKACERAGLRVLKTEYRGYCRQYSPAWAKAEAQVARVLRQASPRQLRLDPYPLVQAAQLVASAAASASRRYDSVRVICTA